MCATKTRSERFLPNVALAGEVPFYIPAVDAPARPRRNLKHNDTFAVFDSHGDIGASAGGEDGLFEHDTRYLSHLELLMSGSRPLLLHSAVSDDNLTFVVDLTNPDIYVHGRLALAKDTIHISRTIYLDDGALRERVSLANHGADRATFVLTIGFASDFADIFEVRGVRRMHRGRAWNEVIDAGTMRLHYRGLDGVERHTGILFQPAPQALTPAMATYALQLEPGETQVHFVAISSHDGRVEPGPSFFRGLLALKRDNRALTGGIATVETANTVVNEILCRSMADLYMLTTITPDGAYPYAGIPWYSTTFGRDGIITALEMLWCDPQIAKGVLRRLARLQAVTTDAATDAEPGKIVHEMRGGEMALLGEVPFQQYYGSVDATPLFVMLASAYGHRTGDWDLVREIWPAIEAAIGWLDGPADSDGDGFVEYERGADTGLANQGWKDSHDAVFHADGRLAEGPIALCEVQGYVYAARRLAARCARRLGQCERADTLDRQANTLAERFEAAFWCEELGTYALALDGDKKPCRVRTSNAGQVLFSGIAHPDHAEAVARDLMRPSFFSGWGIRTVAREEARYNPMSYHNGSVWPHDNALIAAGFARYGQKSAIERVFKGLFDAASYMELRRLPELYCGFQRGHQRGPTLYPVACSPQAWAAATPLMLLQASLGLEFDADRNEIRLRQPRLPRFLEEVTLRNLQFGHATLDLKLRRHDTDVSIQVLRNDGQIRVSAVY